MVKTNVSDGASKTFGAAALGMSWQLAVIVLVGVFGGYKLDMVTDMSPVWTLAGLVLAIAGSIVVVRKALKDFGNFEVPTDKERPQ